MRLPCHVIVIKIKYLFQMKICISCVWTFRLLLFDVSSEVMSKTVVITSHKTHKYTWIIIAFKFVLFFYYFLQLWCMWEKKSTSPVLSFKQNVIFFFRFRAKINAMIKLINSPNKKEIASEQAWDIPASVSIIWYWLYMHPWRWQLFSVLRNSSHPCWVSHTPRRFLSFTLALFQSSVNYCSHSSRGVKVRPATDARMGLTVRHVGEAQRRLGRTRDRELELQRQRRTGARSIFASRIQGSPAPVTKTGAQGSNAVMSAP